MAVIEISERQIDRLADEGYLDGDNTIAQAYGGTGQSRCLGVFFITAAATMLTMAVVKAQTLTNPNPKPHTSAAPSQQDKQQVKPCPAYGAGFVQVPGTDLCIKVGGYVQGEIVGH